MRCAQRRVQWSHVDGTNTPIPVLSLPAHATATVPRRASLSSRLIHPSTHDNNNVSPPPGLQGLTHLVPPMRPLEREWHSASWQAPLPLPHRHLHVTKMRTTHPRCALALALGASLVLTHLVPPHASATAPCPHPALVSSSCMYASLHTLASVSCGTSVETPCAACVRTRCQVRASDNRAITHLHDIP